MHLKRIQSHVLSFLLLVGLSACSGGGDTPTPSTTVLPASPAEGLWIGATNANPNRTVMGVVLDDGVYWFLYSVPGDPSLIVGVVQGDSSSQNGALTSSNATDFSVERGITPTLNATVDGTYTTKQSLNGTIVYKNNAQTQDTFATTYNSEYDLVPDMNAVAGTYTGRITSTETVTVDVLSNGVISGRSVTGSGAVICTFSGSFSPRAHGNVFDITITFHGQADCSNGADTVNGIAFYDSGSKTLYSAALNSARDNGFVFKGTKP